ncbi:hypothetical protein RHMOL_Rhmol11G0120200 [Rhododendron molle]|uniref:Uncharacterized protein n=1 Tax=Rhododendron molle TaxID=49168 RepID=A0ACC0LRC2_RHOML|nr:hypothetical protein RHMOL_Rhmol11G0120200 [Rhododendron molle]
MCVDSLPASTNSGIVLEEVLKEPPKWKVLRVRNLLAVFRQFITIFTWDHVFQEVLEEIEEEREKHPLSRVDPVIEGEEDDDGIVLVACKDERSCMQLEDCIIKGPHKVFIADYFSPANDFHFSCLLLLLSQAVGKAHNHVFARALLVEL